ncbi:glycosyltransferase [Nocardioides sp. T5]|uniref:glycosyltransferase n=1 Tax=Nocardioides sp. T5 TaxID=3400182 RepID=UPI003A88448A
MGAEGSGGLESAPKRILIANKYWRPAGGVENHAFAVKEALESMGHEVFPFAMSEPDTLPAPHGDLFPSSVDFRNEGFGNKLSALGRATLSIGARKDFKSFLDEVEPDAAYVLHVYHQLGMPILNVLSDRGIPTILSLHDYKISCPNYRLFSERTQRVCTRCLDSKYAYLTAPIKERCWDNSVGAGVALSAEALFTKAMGSYGKADVISVLNDLQEHSVRVSGVQRPIMRLPHPVAQLGDREKTDRKTFLYVGRLVPEKGIDDLIRAVAMTGHTLRIVGDGRSGEELSNLAEQMHADVEFVGSLDAAGVAREYAQAVALVVPSTWHEVSPLVVYEAIANDVPVIATAMGGMVDQLRDGRGYLVPPNDPDAIAAALNEVFGDQVAAQRVSGRARNHMRETQSPEQWVESLRALFQAVDVEI